jgi:flagellin
MARINSNIPSLVAQSQYATNQRELQLRFERLSTGLRINRGADDPAGLIISERLRSDIQGVNQGIKNSDRASSVISTTESALTEINDLLNSIRSLVVEASNTGANSTEERNANQLQIDSAIDSITRISNTASFGGLKLLNGSLDYTLSGVDRSDIVQTKVWNASRINQQNLQVQVDVIGSAQTGALFYQGIAAQPGVIVSTTTLQIAGARGVQELTITSATGLASVVTAVNNLTSLTGVRARLINNDANSGMVFESDTYGSEAFASVKRLGGPTNPAADAFQVYKALDSAATPAGTPFDWAGLTSAGTLVTAVQDAGRDVTALVNGNLATGRGTSLSINASSLGLDLQLSDTFATDPTAAVSAFYITGGGALFQLGPEVTALQQSNLGIPSVAASNLGGTLTSGRLEFLNSLKTGAVNSIATSVARNDFTKANDILQTAIDEVTVLRGRLGAFERNVLQTNSRSLQAALENLSSSNSQIRDADFAVETSALTRAQILSSSGTSVLTLANQSSQQVLQLLG